MRNLLGLELMCFGRTEHFEVTYDAGNYLDPAGEPVSGILDMNCYVCTASFYTREADAIRYCPNCGHIDRKRFETREALVEFMTGNDLSWMSQAGLSAVAVHTLDGDWLLRITPRPAELQATGRYREVRSL